MFTVYPKIYDESKLPERGSCKGKGIGAFTSGGDSQGMNAALRAIVRVGLYLGCKVFLIKEGYQGMVDGGDNIIEATWESVSAIIHKGGTVIGSARCRDFVQREGRLKAAKNLVLKGITKLVVIGGDGSLSGADCFKTEYPDLLKELASKGEITAQQQKECGHLHIAGIVGSIDNDFCGTNMTVGADSALHRITEAIDATVSTAYSHKRVFILEVMGRHCGYLAIVAAMSCAADYIFIPESPSQTDWEEDLCTKLKEERYAGQRLNIILVAEGAIDCEGQPITAEMVKKAVEDRLQQDTRITVLGHVQRGGNPSAFDRIIGSRMGTEAVLALIEDDNPNQEACVITITGTYLERKNLMECVRKTKDVAEALKNKDWKKAVKLRGEGFEDNLKMYKILQALTPPGDADKPQAKRGNYIIALMNVGAPAGGMNAVARSFIRYTLWSGDVALGIHKGIEGFLKGQVQNMCWSDVAGWVAEGGCMLGTKRTTVGNRIGECADLFGNYGINAIMIVGGFEAYQVAIELMEGRKQYQEFCIPIVVVPATISNNVPGTEFSLGCDTALNEIANICDDIRLSAQGTHRRVFIIETMGGYCGYLATLAGLASGADASYIFEEEATITDLQMDLLSMAAKMASGVITRGIILKNEFSSVNYNTEFLLRLYKEEGKGLFSTRQNILGYAQQGGAPSPFDRTVGTKLSFKAKDYIMKQLKKAKEVEPGIFRISTPESAVVLGFIKQDYCFTPIEELMKKTDFEHRIPKEQWWLRLRLLLKTLAMHESAYEDKQFRTKGRLLQKYFEMKQEADEAITPVFVPESMAAFNPLSVTYHNFILPSDLRRMTAHAYQGDAEEDSSLPVGIKMAIEEGGAEEDSSLPVATKMAIEEGGAGKDSSLPVATKVSKGPMKGYLDVNVKINIK